MTTATRNARNEAKATYAAAKAKARATYLRTVKAALADARKVLGTPAAPKVSTYTHRIMSPAEHAAYLRSI